MIAMDTNTIQELLTNITGLSNWDHYKQSLAEDSGMHFNVFTVLGLWSEEVQLHSAFLAEFLRTDGSHGLREKGLQLFLTKLKENHPDELKELSCYFNDIKNCTVDVEYNIGKISPDYVNGGRIDILIRGKSKAIIIENKIYARDQYKQLIRYNNYANQTFGEDNYKILYLTLSGEEASSDSADGVEYTSISYKSDIVSWLESVLPLSFDKPYVREVLPQYISLIKQLTETRMENEDLLKYTNESKESIYSSLLISANIKDIQKRALVKVVFPTIEEMLKELKENRYPSMEFCLDYGKDRPVAKNYTFDIDIKTESEMVRVTYIFDKDGLRNLYWGVNTAAAETTIPKPDGIGNWMFGWAWAGDYCDWSDPSVFKKVMEGEFAKYVKNNLEEVIRKYL